MPEQLHELLLRLKALFLKRRMDRDMADELAFHRAMLEKRLLQQGVSPSELDAQARLSFGNTSRWHERLRELWQFRGLENLARDIAFSARVLRKSAGFTSIAVLTIALGVGANTTVFSVINGLLLRPLPVPDSKSIAVIGIAWGDPLGFNYSLSEPLFRGLEHRREVFSKVFAFDHEDFQVKGTSGIEKISGQIVSGEFFNALETPPLLGRTLGVEDDRKGGDPAGFGVVISESFWQRWFDRSPHVIGSKVQIDHALFTVVGVMPKRFIGADPLEKPDLFVSMSTEPVLHGHRNMTAGGYHTWWLTAMGRLKPQATLEQANAQLGSESNAVLHEVIPDAGWIAETEKRHFRFIAEPGSAGFNFIRVLFRKPLMAVFAMCGGILLLACMNLASLLMARGAARQKELATRLAMGATRRRLVQQLLVESLLIAGLGTAAGLAISPLAGSSLAAVLLGGQGDVRIDTSLDIRVFAFAAVAAIAAALLVGLVPALQATSRSLNEQMKSGQHTTQAHERRRVLPRVMMAGEVGLALMLVVGAGLIATSLVRLYRSGAGFDPRGIENIAFNMDRQSLKGDALLQFYRLVGDGLRKQPGVTNVTFAKTVPFTHWVWTEEMSTSDGKSQNTYQNSVAPDYFRTMGIPLFEGRDFAWSDTASTGPKVILNKSAAKFLFQDRNPIGQMVSKQDHETKIQYQIVGIVGDAKYEDLRQPAPPTAYFPMSQDDDSQGPSYIVVVRTVGPAAPLADTARSLARELAPGTPMPVMTSMSSIVDDSLGAERMMTTLSVFFAICALVVTAIGLYGTLAYATARRTSEIGIRMALGARRTQVAAMVFRQNAGVALAGTAAGLLAALLASRALASFLYGISARDPWVFAGSILALAIIASAASLLPALRSARIEPMAAIRCE